ncbi:MAG: carboxypeptidase M32, partial [Actinomycetota bacterium]|nr:carboxypeptidase M32 [Actinomycetota bacterium]
MLSPELDARLGELTDLGAAGALLGWDQQTMMPPGGGEARGNVMATLATLAHERQTAPELGVLLDAAQPDGEGEQAIVRVARRDHDKARRVPTELAAAMELAAARAQEPWAHARATNDFAHFRPYLERNLELRRRYVDCFEGAEHPYDTLLDNFEPGLTTARVREVFGRLREGLMPLVAALAGAEPAPVLPGPFPIAAQQELALELARAFGFDDGSWRMDLAVHPFAQSLSPQDIRVTARYKEDDLQGLFAVMHEVGHGLYEHQVDPALARTTLGTGVSLGVHESQSRLWENLVGRSEPFWRHWGPKLRAAFPEGVGELSDHDLLRAINAVKPGLIRVDADEVTYSLHVILRFELEVAMIEGTLAIADLPGAWNAGMQNLLGVAVPDDAHGVLQDIHWSFGELGYFPTYAIGNIVAAQLWT